MSYVNELCLFSFEPWRIPLSMSPMSPLSARQKFGELFLAKGRKPIGIAKLLVFNAVRDAAGKVFLKYSRA